MLFNNAISLISISVCCLDMSLFKGNSGNRVRFHFSYQKVNSVLIFRVKHNFNGYVYHSWTDEGTVTACHQSGG